MEYYKENVETVIKSFSSNTEKGLNKDQVETQRKEFGFNELDTKTKINKLKIFIEQFKSFIIYILIFAVAFSFLVGEYVDGVIILAILVINALIGFFQEISAKKSLEALKKLTKIEAKVLREGEVIKTDSKYLVPGDIIKLEAGDKVPADCRIIEANRLKVQESALTGESESVSKNNEQIQKEVQIGDRKNMLFSSTNITEGTAIVLVVKTAMKTEIGKITSMIKEAKDDLTPLQIRLDRFGKRLAMIILGICILIFSITAIKEYLLNGFTIEALLPAVMIAIALAVAAVPEGLPAVVTIALSVGVKKLLRKKALVSNLSSVETLGSCDVICTDKTGTLTKNEMTVRHAWTLDGESEIEGVGYNPQGYVSNKLNPLLYEIGINCNNASIFRDKGMWKISGDPTEASLIVSANKNKINNYKKKIDEIPFDSDRKLMSVLIKEKNNYFVYTKGAPDKILDSCTYILKDGKKIKLDSNFKKKILDQNFSYAKEALRVLGFAYKEISNKDNFTEKNLIFVGFQAMIDPPRPDVIESIKKTKQAGIRTIMITGDYKETARAIGKEVGIEGNVMTGDELSKINDLELTKKLKDDTNIFARVIPEHKQRIVDSLQKMGHTVAMTGDGVNDAPALKKANIGVAVGSGTDVAKEASDLILLDDSFSHIANAIEEGRGIYDNIQKVILHLLSGNLAEVLIIFLAVLFGFNLPLTAIFLLWINLITDGAPALALSVDPYNKKIMQRKPIPAKQGILTKKWWSLISFLGLVTTIIGLFLFSYFGGNSGNLNVAQSVIFSFIVITETLLLLMIRSIYKVPIFENMWLWITIIFSFLSQAAIIYLPFMNKWFETTPLSLEHLSFLAFGGALFIIAFFIYRVIDERFVNKVL